MRLDLWLFFARLFKSRSLAQTVIAAGRVRLNGRVALKPAQTVAVGDELILPAGKRWRRVTVLALAERRGPACEAQTLYDDSAPPEMAED